MEVQEGRDMSRRCPTCGKQIPARKDGHGSYCKPCYNAYNRARRTKERKGRPVATPHRKPDFGPLMAVLPLPLPIIELLALHIPPRYVAAGISHPL